jgi:hypothetical protein
VTLPSSAAGELTQTVGYIQAPLATVAPWLRDGMGDKWEMRPVQWQSLADAAAMLAPSPEFTREAAIEVDGWTMLLTNGPAGTDVGVVPSLAARQLGCRALRALCVPDDEDIYPARLLEVFGPDGEPPLLARRSITAANDGGKWVFETFGEPFEFEDLEQYKRRRKSERFPPELLYKYLRALGVPIDAEPDWSRTQLLESRSR